MDFAPGAACAARRRGRAATSARQTWRTCVTVTRVSCQACHESRAWSRVSRACLCMWLRMCTHTHTQTQTHTQVHPREDDGRRFEQGRRPAARRRRGGAAAQLVRRQRRTRLRAGHGSPPFSLGRAAVVLHATGNMYFLATLSSLPFSQHEHMLVIRTPQALVWRQPIARRLVAPRLSRRALGTAGAPMRLPGECG